MIEILEIAFMHTAVNHEPEHLGLRREVRLAASVHDLGFGKVNGHSVHGRGDAQA